VVAGDTVVARSERAAIVNTVTGVATLTIDVADSMEGRRGGVTAKDRYQISSTASAGGLLEPKAGQTSLAVANEPRVRFVLKEKAQPSQQARQQSEAIAAIAAAAASSAVLTGGGTAAAAEAAAAAAMAGVPAPPLTELPSFVSVWERAVDTHRGLEYFSQAPAPPAVAAPLNRPLVQARRQQANALDTLAFVANFETASRRMTEVFGEPYPGARDRAGPPQFEKRLMEYARGEELRVLRCPECFEPTTPLRGSLGLLTGPRAGAQHICCFRARYDEEAQAWERLPG